MKDDKLIDVFTMKNGFRQSQQITGKAIFQVI
jgi:hypothetical protein